MNKKISLIISISIFALLLYLLSNIKNNSSESNVNSNQPTANNKQEYPSTLKSESNKQHNPQKKTYTYQGKYEPGTPTQEALSILMSQKYEQQLSDLINLAHSNPDNTLIQYAVLSQCRETNESCYMEPFINNILSKHPNDALAKSYLANHYLSLGDDTSALNIFSSTDPEDKTFAYFQETIKAAMENYQNDIKIKHPNHEFYYPSSYEDSINSSIRVAAAVAIPYARMFNTCKKYIEHSSWRDACYNFGTVYKNNKHTLMDMTMGDAYQRLATNRLEVASNVREYVTKLSKTMGKVETSGKFTDNQRKLYLNELFEYGEEVAMLKLFERLGFEY